MGRYLGLDASTQSLSALVIDTDTGEVVLNESVSFAEDLPEYGCVDGVLPHADPLIRHSDPCLWAAALDLLCERVRQSGFDWADVDAISGSGQQHGSVYLRAGFPPQWTGRQSLAEQVKFWLTRATSPVWMDSSTSAECDEIARNAGGDATVTAISGSRAIERFTGPQIRKFWKETPEAYAQTGRIHLVSSFMASLLCGADVPIDFGDGAGMNLLDLKAGDWSPLLLDATAPGLTGKLLPPVPSSAIGGTVHPYFVERYGFRAGTPVVVFSGDNPNSLIGMGAGKPGIAVISLGTSDTYFAAMRDPVTDPDGYGHVFGNPSGGFMSLICFKNGSLARERIRDQFGLSWDAFSAAILQQTPPGNNGNLMLPYFVPEITPRILDASVKRSGTPGFVAGTDVAAQARAVVEAQALSMKQHAAWIVEAPTQILLTGGASQNSGIAQVIADVFNAEIKRLPVTNSAALGAAMRAASAVGKISWNALAAAFAAPDAAGRVQPDPQAVAVYADSASRFAAFLSEQFPGS